MTGVEAEADVLGVGRLEDAVDVGRGLDVAVTVRVQARATGDGEVIRLTETGPNTGVFTGYVPTRLAGGGAANAGIHVGDVILAVDGVPLTTLGIEGVIEALRGVEGTEVRVRLERAGATAEEEVVVVRMQIRR